MTNRTGSILVVDDEADMVSGLKRIVRLDNYPVETAETAKELLSRSNWSDYFAIILDRKLPDGTADELLPKVKELAPHAAIIIVTGYSDLDGTLSALRHGADDYLIKPVNPDALRATLGRIVERNKAEARLLQAERLSAIGEAMAGIAHESRNALNVAQSALRIIERDVQDRPQLKPILQGGHHALLVIQRLFDEVREYVAPVVVRHTRCNLPRLIEDTWQTLAPVRDRRMAFIVQAPGDVTPECDACPIKLGQVFRNLFENALAACEDPVKIEVHYGDAEIRGKSALRVAVTDNGPGLNEDQRAHMFDAFYTTKTHGAGLGMAISKRIVEAHGGTIGVGDANGRGAQFVITLPVEKS